MRYVTPEQHHSERLHVPPAHRQHHVEPISAPLYVVTAVTNPEMYYARHKHYRAFERHIEDSGAVLYTVELALRDRHHEITRHDNPHHVQLRGKSEIWYKENLMNIGVSRLPADWEYVAFIDADFHFTRPDWVDATKHALQRHKWVQVFHQYSNLDNRYNHLGTMSGFAYSYINGKRYPKEHGGMGATGGAWACRRSGFEDVGGLLDCCILGSADWHMSFALAQLPDTHQEIKQAPTPYVKAIHDWRDRAKAVNRDIGYLENYAVHYWHGPIRNRGYGSRWRVLVDHQFDPSQDLKRDHQGLWQLREHKPGLRDDCRRYFASRDEDQLA